MSSSVGEVGKSPAGVVEAVAGMYAPAATVALATAAEELHRVGHDLDRLALVSFGSLPLTPLEPSVHGHRPALREVLRAPLPLVAPHGDVEVVGLVRPLTGLVLAPRVDRESQVADGRAGRRVAQLGILGQVADEHDAIDGDHSLLLLRGVRGGLPAIVADRRRPAPLSRRDPSRVDVSPGDGARRRRS